MLIDELKQRMFAAMKAKSLVEKEILRTAIGEVTRTGEEATDKKVIAILRKMGKSCQETLALTTDELEKQKIHEEMAVLESFLPKALSIADIVTALAPVTEQIRAAGNDGQATGVAMKQLKSTGAEVNGKDVAQAVKQIRS